MIFLFGMVVIALGLLALAYPLFQPQKAENEPVEPSEEGLAGLLERRDAAYNAIRELEFDYSLGNITQEDYQVLLDRYQLRAATILKALDEGYAGWDEELEGAVRARRAKRAVAGGVGLACPQCAAPYGGTDKFCSRCGTKLPRQGETQRSGKGKAPAGQRGKDRRGLNRGRSQ